MTSVKAFCVFCNKKSEKLNIFTADTLLKCKNTLKIRQDYNLTMSDIKVPPEANNIQQYHSKCYRAFTALSRKYRKKIESISNPTIAE